MYRAITIVAIVIVVATTVAIASPANDGKSSGSDNISVKVVSSDELKNLLRQFPNAQPLQRSATRTLGVRGVTRDLIRYTVGQRIRGDRRVAFKEHTNSWSEPNDVELELNYPDVGIGAVISYIQVLVDQSHNKGQAYVLRGGIGQRFVTLILEAINTNYFNYEAAIYGQD